MPFKIIYRHVLVKAGGNDSGLEGLQGWRGNHGGWELVSDVDCSGE